MNKKKLKDNVDWLKVFQLACEELQKNKKMPAEIAYHNAKVNYDNNDRQLKML